MQDVTDSVRVSSEDNYKLFNEYKTSKDNTLRNTIAEKYLYIAEIMAKKFANKGVEYDDLFQISSLALIKAIDRFDPEVGVKFSTFATPSIIGEIKNYFRDKARLIKPGRKNNQIILNIKNAINELCNNKNYTPNAEEIAKHLNIETEAVIEAMEYNSSVISLDKTMEDNQTPLYEIIPDSENIFEKYDDRDALKIALSKLNKEEKELIEKRFNLNMSQAAIATQMNVSQMFVSRLEKKIIKKLKNMFEIN